MLAFSHVTPVGQGLFMCQIYRSRTEQRCVSEPVFFRLPYSLVKDGYSLVKDSSAVKSIGQGPNNVLLVNSFFHMLSLLVEDSSFVKSIGRGPSNVLVVSLIFPHVISIG